MSELSSRARLVAARQGLLTGDKTQQRVRCWLRLLAAETNVHSTIADPQLAVDVLALDDMLFEMAVLMALAGQDIQDALASVIGKREMGVRRPIPNSLAPMPDNEGNLRDPATGNISRIDRDGN